VAVTNNSQRRPAWKRRDRKDKPVEPDDFAIGIINSFPGAFIVLDKEWRIIYLNSGAKDLLKCHKNDTWLGKPFREVSPVSLGHMLSPDIIGRILRAEERSITRYSNYNRKWYRISAGSTDTYVFIQLSDVTHETVATRLLRVNEFCVRQAPDMIFWFKERGQIIYGNESVNESLGYTREEIARMKVSDIDPAFGGGTWSHFLINIKAKERMTFESRFLTKDGSYIPVEVSCSYTMYYDEEYIIAFVRNISWRKRGEDALKEAKAQAELYVDLMGHDINNMNQVGIGFLEMAMESPALPGELRRILEQSKAAFENSSSLIKNVRQLQKIKVEEGLKEELIDVDVGLIIKNTKNTMEMSSGKRIAIRCDCSEVCKVKANPLIRDLFGNIVGNAIKHADSEAVEIDIRVNNIVKENQRLCEVSIEDNGPGIPDDVKTKLFEHTHEKRYRSRGLGLFIVKALVDRFNGSIRVEDRVSGDYTKGVRFVVLLPAAD